MKSKNKKLPFISGILIFLTLSLQTHLATASLAPAEKSGSNPHYLLNWLGTEIYFYVEVLSLNDGSTHFRLLKGEPGSFAECKIRKVTRDAGGVITLITDHDEKLSLSSAENDAWNGIFPLRRLRATPYQLSRMGIVPAGRPQSPTSTEPEKKIDTSADVNRTPAKRS
jgi:hypothetical protein